MVVYIHISDKYINVNETYFTINFVILGQYVLAMEES